MNNDVNGINEAYSGTFFNNAHAEKLLGLYRADKTREADALLYEWTKTGVMNRSNFFLVLNGLREMQ